jgi:hypothetical protein
MRPAAFAMLLGASVVARVCVGSPDLSTMLFLKELKLPFSIFFFFLIWLKIEASKPAGHVLHLANHINIFRDILHSTRGCVLRILVSAPQLR